MRIILISLFIFLFPVFSNAVDINQYLGKLAYRISIGDKKIFISDIQNENELMHGEKHILNLKEALNSTEDHIIRFKLTNKLNNTILDLLIVKFRIYSDNLPKIKESILEFRKDIENIDYINFYSLVLRTEKMLFSENVSEEIIRFMIEEWEKYQKQNTDYNSYKIVLNLHKMVSRSKNIDEINFFKTINKNFFNNRFILIKQELDLLVNSLYLNRENSIKNSKINDFVMESMIPFLKEHREKKEYTDFIMNYSLRFRNYNINSRLIDKIKKYISEEDYNEFTMMNNYLHGNPKEFLKSSIDKYNSQPDFLKAKTIIDMGKLLKIPDNYTEIIAEKLGSVQEKQKLASYILDNTDNPETIIKLFDYLKEIKDYQLSAVLKNYDNRFDVLITKLMHGNIIFTGNKIPLFKLFIMKNKDDIAFTFAKNVNKYADLKHVIEILMKYNKLDKNVGKLSELLKKTELKQLLKLSDEFKNNRIIIKLVLNSYVSKETSEKNLIDFFKEIVKRENIHLYEIMNRDKFEYLFSSSFVESLMKNTIDTRIYNSLGIYILQNSDLMTNNVRIENCLNVLHKAGMYVESKNLIKNMVRTIPDLENSVYSHLTHDFVNLKEFKEGILYYRKLKNIDELTSLINQLFIMFKMKDFVSAEFTINQILGLKLKDKEKQRAYKNIYNNYYPLLNENKKSEIMKLTEKDENFCKTVIRNELNDLIKSDKYNEFFEHVQNSRNKIKVSELDEIIFSMNPGNNKKFIDFFEKYFMEMGRIKRSDRFYIKIISNYVKYLKTQNTDNADSLIRKKIESIMSEVNNRKKFYESASMILEKNGFDSVSEYLLEKLMDIDETMIPQLHSKFLDDEKVMSKLLKNTKYSKEVLISLLVYKCKNNEFSTAISLLNRKLSDFEEKMRILFFLYGKFPDIKHRTILIDELFRLYKERYSNKKSYEIPQRLEFVKRMVDHGIIDKTLKLPYLTTIFNNSEYKVYSETLRKMNSKLSSRKLICKLNLYDAKENDLNKFFGENTIEIRLFRKIVNQENIETFIIDNFERLVFHKEDYTLIFNTAIYLFENTLDYERKIKIFNILFKPLINISKKMDIRFEKYINMELNSSHIYIMIKALYYKNKENMELLKKYENLYLKYIPVKSGFLRYLN